MNLIKKIWPFSFESDTLKSFIFKIIIYVVLGVAFSTLIALLKHVPVLNIIFYIVGPLVDIYVICGLIFLILNYIKVLK